MLTLSVIIPAYQAEAYIEKCIRSILTNTIDLEILVVNDGSTDGTEAICKRMADQDSRIQVWTKENGGPGAAREYALAHARGEYITFADADDYLDSNAYDQLADYLENLDILEFGYRLVGTDGHIISRHPMAEEFCNAGTCGIHYAQQKNTTNYLCNKIFRRSLFENVVFPHLYASEDAALLSQLFVVAKSYRVVPSLLYNYVMTPDSLCRKSFSSKKADAIKAYWFIDEYYAQKSPELRFYAQQKLCSLAATLYCECDRTQEDALRHFLPQFIAEYRKVRQYYRMTQILGHGSYYRRAMLLLFELSPKLCSTLYRLVRK